MSSASDRAVEAARLEQQGNAIDQALVDAVSQGVASAGSAARSFNTTSNNLAGKLIAEERSIKELLGDLEEERKRLDERYEDAMLAHSMITAALGAAERGRK